MDLVSPQPFWPLKNGLLGIYPPLRESVRCDVVILGGGISGALMAERLSEEGLDVVLVEKRDVGAGSTSASTSLLQYEIDTPLVELTKLYGATKAERAYRLCHDSIDEIERLVDKLDIECAFQRKKSVYLATRRRDAKSLRKECVARQAAGIAVEYLEEADISARFSFSREAALVSTQGAELDCYVLTHALLKRSVKNGARIFDKTIIEENESSEAGVRLTTDRGCVIQAKHAVFATGYESQDFLPRKVVTLKSTYALASEPLDAFPGWWEQCLLWETARPYLYLRTTNDRRALVGGEDDDFRNPARRDALVDRKTDRIAEKFRELFPEIELEVAFRWAGTFGETKDGLAYIGTVRQMPRCHFVLGFGGNGITYSVIAASLVRDAILGRANSDAEIFCFDR